MENSILEIKKELTEWIESLDDFEILQEVLKIKNVSNSSTLISDINSDTVIENNFDEQYAAGMTSDELLENIAAHMETMACEENSPVVSDSQSEYAVKNDFDERFAKGMSSEAARKESKERVREWWGK